MSNISSSSLTVLFFLVWLAALPVATAQGKPDTWPDALITIFETEGQQAAERYYAAQTKAALAQKQHLVYLQLIEMMGYGYLDYTDSIPQVATALSSAYKLPFTPANAQEWKVLARIFINLGYTYAQDLGDYESAVKPYRQAFDIYEKHLGVEDTFRAIYLEKWLGNIYTRLGDHAAAEAHLKRAYRILLDQQSFEEAVHIASDLGVLYHNWDKPEHARQIFSQGIALPIADKTPRILLIINNVGFLLDNGDAAAALPLLAQAKLLTQTDNDYLRKHRSEVLGAILQKEATAYQQQGQYARALGLIDQSVANYRTYYETDKRRELGKLYNQKGYILLGMSDYQAAANQFQQALRSVLYEYAPTRPTDLPDAKDFYAENTITEALEGLAAVFRQWHRQSPDAGHLAHALRCLEYTYAAEAALRRGYRYESSKLFTLEESRRRSETAIAVAWELYQATRDDDYIRQAFVFAERNRSALLRETFRATQATALAGISDEDRQQEHQLKQRVSEAEEQVFHLRAAQADETEIAAAEQQLLRARDALANWLQDLEVRHPRYFQLKYADDLPTVAQLQTLLHPRQLLVEYFVGEEALYVFTIGQGGLALQALPLPAQLDERVLQFRKSITDYQLPNTDKANLMERYRAGGQALYRDLLAPVLAAHPQHDELLIVPSGILDILPFEALLTSGVRPDAPLASYPYLLRQYAVGYSYSAALQWQLAQLPLRGKGYAGFAPTFDGAGGWPALTCSADLLQRVQPDDALRLANQATRAAFQQWAGGVRLLHLGTHAQANTDQGEFSFIVFSDGRGGYDSLFTKDLYLMNLQAELVILSACETALGTLYNSEGVVGLARGFHYAGAGAVLTTLWRINESANCSLMEHLYGQLEMGHTKTIALRNAKLAYFEGADDRAAHPVYWAGFQMLGNARPLDTPRPRSRWWWVLVALGVAGVVGAIIIRR